MRHMTRTMPWLSLIILLVPLACAKPTNSRPALLWQSKEGFFDGGVQHTIIQPPFFAPRSVVSELRAAKKAISWPGMLLAWAEEHVNAPWFPLLLGVIGFLDPFTMCGFMLTPLISLALLTADFPRAVVLCGAASSGCLAGGVVFTQLLGRLNVASKLEGSQALAVASELLRKHGVLAGVLNTLLPLPTIPLMLAAQIVGANVPLILVMMALGRLSRYVAVYAAIVASRVAYRSSVRWQDEPMGHEARASAT